MTTFVHQKDDVVITVRFRADVWNHIDAMMHNRKYNPNKKMFGVPSHVPTKSVHTVLDQELRKLMKQ